MSEQVFSHKPVLLDECLEALAIRPDGVYLDGALAASLPLKSERPAPSKPLFHLDGLDLGPHAVVLRPKGGKIAVDARIAQWRPQVV